MHSRKNDVGDEVLPSKIFFQVLVEFNPEAEEVPDDICGLESAMPLATLENAEYIAKKLAGKIHQKFPKSCLTEKPLEEAFDGYHLLIVNTETGIHIARVGISGEDYSQEQIH